jgi:hypothetical protein
MPMTEDVRLAHDLLIEVAAREPELNAVLPEAVALLAALAAEDFDLWLAATGDRSEH